MIISWLRKYFAVVFVVATLLGSMHHHNDLKQHNDCQICTIASSIADADTPVDFVYLTLLSLQSEATLTQLPEFTQQHVALQFHSRAPPQITL